MWEQRTLATIYEHDPLLNLTAGFRESMDRETVELAAKHVLVQEVEEYVYEVSRLMADMSARKLADFFGRYRSVFYPDVAVSEGWPHCDSTSAALRR